MELGDIGASLGDIAGRVYDMWEVVPEGWRMALYAVVISLVIVFLMSRRDAVKDFLWKRISMALTLAFLSVSASLMTGAAMDIDWAKDALAGLWERLMSSLG